MPSVKLQFPDHRPVPPAVYTKEFDQPGRSGERQPDTGRPADHNTYVAETEGPHLPEIPEEGDHDEGEDCNEDGDELVPAPEDGQEGEDLSGAILEAAQVLTVTARRLQGVTLGRKFSNKPRSIEERKRSSYCAACGQKGHLQGDAVCPPSGANAGNKAKPTPKASATPSASSSRRDGSGQAKMPKGS